MAPARAPSTQLLRSLKGLTLDGPSTTGLRAFSTRNILRDEAQLQKPFFKNLDSETAFVPRLERKLIRAGKPVIGSRRRRMALATSQQIPFDELPYQCFQEARQILIADRQEKIKKLETERARITRLQETDPNRFAGGEAYKQKRLQSMQLELERLKILADVNDPTVKRRFEDGKADMSKPIYRYLADRKWRDYRRKILVQRLEQMKVVPDVVPYLDPILDIRMSFGLQGVQPGDFVDSKISEKPCRLNIQSFEREERLVTIAVVDSDVPNVESDTFDSRCHFLASNIKISPTTPRIDLSKLTGQQVLLPWAAPYAQKGSPYHRLSIVVLQQKDNVPIDLSVAMKKVQREGFLARSFMTRHMLHPIGGTLFRIKWDESMPGVMRRAGIEGADVELKRVKVEPLPYKRRNPSTFR